MVNSSRPVPPPPAPRSVPVLNHSTVKKCHIIVPDLPKPVGAIAHEGEFYSYFRAYEDVASVQRVAAKLIRRGDKVLLTQVRKGLILWVLEPDAQLAGTAGH